MHEYTLDESVRVVPTQGGYQKTLSGKVTKVTKTQVIVTDEKHHYGVTYRRAGVQSRSGIPVLSG